MSLRNAAQQYASKGWPVLPLNIEKKPRNTHGLTDATTDPDQINSWWDQWPDAGIGVVTGKISGFVVLDIDDAAGYGHIKDAGFDIPEGPVVKTGRGWHHYFKAPEDIDVRNFANKLPHVDFRGNGGYVVMPPTIHETGHVYCWENEDDNLPEVPAWLLDLCAKKLAKDPSPGGLGTRGNKGARDAPITGGSRNDSLFKIGCSHRADGLDEAQITALLVLDNDRRCSPPLDHDEVIKISESVGRYEAGNPSTRFNDALDDLATKGIKLPAKILEGLAEAGVKLEEATKTRKIEIEMIANVPINKELDGSYDLTVMYDGGMTKLRNIPGSQLNEYKSIAKMCANKMVHLPPYSKESVKIWCQLIATHERNAPRVVRASDEDPVGACMNATMDWIRSRTAVDDVNKVLRAGSSVVYEDKQGVRWFMKSELRNFLGNNLKFAGLREWTSSFHMLLIKEKKFRVKGDVGRKVLCGWDEKEYNETINQELDETSE